MKQQHISPDQTIPPCRLYWGVLPQASLYGTPFPSLAESQVLKPSPSKLQFSWHMGDILNTGIFKANSNTLRFSSCCPTLVVMSKTDEKSRTVTQKLPNWSHWNTKKKFSHELPKTEQAALTLLFLRYSSLPPHTSLVRRPHLLWQQLPKQFTSGVLHLA